MSTFAIGILSASPGAIDPTAPRQQRVKGVDAMTEAHASRAKRLRTVARMWYRPDHAAANAGYALVAGYPAGLLRARGVAAGAITSGKVQGGDLVVAWANEWGYLLEPGEDGG